MLMKVYKCIKKEKIYVSMYEIKKSVGRIRKKPLLKKELCM